MSDPVRILILDHNRYRSLLIDRTISEMALPTLTARFTSGIEVVRELAATHHDVAILSLDSLERPVELVRSAGLVRPETRLIVIGLPETPKRVVAAIRPLVDAYLCRQPGFECCASGVDLSSDRGRSRAKLRDREASCRTNPTG